MMKAEVRDDLSIIALPEHIDAECVTLFRTQSKAWLLSDVRAYVLDLERVADMVPGFYQAVIQFKSAMKGSGKALYSLNARPQLLQQLSSDGVKHLFGVVASLAEISPGSRAAPNMSLDVEFLNPFLEGAVKALEVQANTKVRPLKVRLKSEPHPEIAIAGVMSIEAKGFCGSLSLCFSEAVFLKIYENMFGEVHTQISKEIEDAAGELLNIIYGHAKIELNKKPGYELKKALPTVLVGKELRISQQGNSPTVLIPFETDVGPFHIEIGTQTH